MKLKTKYHGTVEYKENDVYYFEKGIPGFEKLNKFVIFPLPDNDVFNILHSVENDETGFVVISPFSVDKTYEIDMENDLIERLKINNQEDVILMCTVTLSSKVEHVTVNLRAPIVLNINQKLGEQIILNDDRYLIKQLLLKEET